ncbi:MAG: tetratricopeptide repeat protein [Planctomycetota bacterium]|nr:tetratricopeptide repeat protein [Planctomycetota bacterium]MDA1139854.1 tetratricopeptide repeat protein [Planctomycetota bacterium]
MTVRNLLVLLLTGTLQGQAPDVKPEALKENQGPAESSISSEQAWKAYQSGGYDEAIQHFRWLFHKQPDTPTDRLSKFVDILLETGKYDEALNTCRKYSEKHPGAAISIISLGEVCFMTGKYGEAEEAFNKGLKISPNSTAAKIGLAMLYKNTGKEDEARTLFNQIVDSFYQDNPTDTDSLIFCGTALQELNKPHQALNMFVKASQKEDGIEGRLATGFLFLDKGQVNDAAAEFRPVLKQNPKHPVARLGMLSCFYHDGQFPKVEEELERVLEVNPNLVEAIEIQASLAYQEENYDLAIALLQQALKINDKNLSVHTTLASVYYLQKDLPKYEAEKKVVETIHPAHAEFYRAIGDAAERLRKPKIAIEFMEKAYKINPTDWRVLQSLGFLYCREGDEVKGYQILEKAFEQNRFSKRVFNMLETLDYMDDFEVYEDESFRIKAHRKQDGFLLRYARIWLSDQQKLLLKQYATAMNHQVVVEMFPRHDYFASRVHGLPGIGLNGVCFGRLIAMDSPRVSPGQFNWKEVLIHEFSHAVTLHATRFNIPRWFTEGLAVYDEHTNRTFTQDQMLVTALKRGEFIRLEDLNRGFTRPKSQFQILLAYVQGEICIDYLVKQHGFEMILALLKSLHQEVSFETAAKDLLGMTMKELSDAMHAHTTALAESLPLLPQYAPQDIERLNTVVQAAPKDANAQADLAYAYLMTGQKEQAEKAVEKALELDPKCAAAARIQGELAFLKQDWDRAKTCFDKSVQLDPKPVGNYFKLALLSKEQGRKGDAVHYLREASKRYPGYSPQFQLMEALANDTNDNDLRLEALEGMLKIDSSAAYAGPLLLNAYSGAGRHADVERVAYRLFEVQPYLLESHEILAQSLRASNKLADAAGEYEACTRINPRKIDNYIKLAKLLIETDRKADARKVLQNARKVDRRNAEVTKLLESLGK